jgi:oligoendopeptidase F
MTEMNRTTLPRRADVRAEDTWDLDSIYATLVDWEAAFTALERRVPDLAAYAGTLTKSPKNLLNWMQLGAALGPEMEKVYIYANLLSDSDTANQTNAARVGRVMGLFARMRAAMAFAEPELLAKLSADKLKAFVTKEPKLKPFAHYFDNLQRQKAHVRSTEVETLMAQASDALGQPGTAYGMLVDADLKFAEAQSSDGHRYAVAQGSIDELQHSTNRALRKNAWESYADGFVGMKNAIAAIYTGKVKASAFNAQARGFGSTLEASLFASNIPVKVYENVIDACNRNLPIWHRYWEIRRRALGLDRAEPCDIFAPLSTPVHATYAQAVQWICEGMAPLGEEYVEAIHKGSLKDRWVDIYPNEGKRSGAYSSGGYATRPFILMSFSESAGLTSMSTLAHELGHSMHTLLSAKHQPFIYAGYTLFAAEVASNFNQALTRAHLLKINNDRNFQIGIIEEAMQNFHRYLFLMPILSQWERFVHGEIERGNALSADDMSHKLAELFQRGYGPAMQVDAARVGITWAQFSHFYADFYVYAYASGISAANALADVILQSDGATREDAVKRYLKFLSSGGSKYPLVALKAAGIDMSKPEPMDRAFKVLEGFVDRLEKLV